MGTFFTKLKRRIFKKLDTDTDSKTDQLLNMANNPNLDNDDYAESVLYDAFSPAYTELSIENHLRLAMDALAEAQTILPVADLWGPVSVSHPLYELVYKCMSNTVSALDKRAFIDWRNLPAGDPHKTMFRPWTVVYKNFYRGNPSPVKTQPIEMKLTGSDKTNEITLLFLWNKMKHMATPSLQIFKSKRDNTPYLAFRFAPGDDLITALTAWVQAAIAATR
mmetsp:Transcript_412/g.453  ORF Transcript_412/g.453 Transcript_412/m.453 type:complete len:221 (+) Transcript_412:281-943(+)